MRRGRIRPGGGVTLGSALLLSVFAAAAGRPPAESHWARLDAGGRLQYDHLERGDRIPDFSSSGYRGGGVRIPTVAQRALVAPSGADDTPAIQRAIDEVARLPLVDGIRGAVVLSRGTFHCAQTISLTASGVVLRGAGAGDQGTTIVMTGSPHLAIRIAGALKVESQGRPWTISDAYVPSGAVTFHVKDASGVRAGDTLLIAKPVTAAWLQLMGMDNLGRRDGKEEHWISGDLEVRRRVASVAGNAVTLEVPLLDSYDQRYLGADAVTVSRVSVTGQVAEVGVENLRVAAPQRSIKMGDPEFSGLRMQDAVDCWLRSLSFEETTSSVAIDRGTERITVTGVDVINHLSVTSSAKPIVFEANGQQILFDRITASGDNTFYFGTQARQQGPVVVLNATFHGNGNIEPHQRWSTGLLVDNCAVPDGGINLRNRGMMGSGHGWAIGWSVIWNSRARSFVVHQPPGAANWSIGDRGQELNPPQPAFDGAAPVPLRQGIIDSPDQPVRPASLYLEQLSERLGRSALRNIGYE